MTRHSERGGLAGGPLDLWAAPWGSESGLEPQGGKTTLSPLIADRENEAQEGRT